MLLIILKSLIVGFLGGFGLTAGAARMFHTPKYQSMGAFRTLGELNACQSDPVSHFSFGLGFLFNSAASSIGAGALTQDVFHRIVPNFAATVLLLKNKKVEETIYEPYKMGLTGGILGAVVVLMLNTMSAVVPLELAKIAKEILTPASNLMINPVMPIVFWLAAIDAGKTTGIWSTILGGLGHMIMGNSLPGLVLGILIGQSIEEKGFTKSVKIMISVVIVLFIIIAYARGFFKHLNPYIDFLMSLNRKK